MDHAVLTAGEGAHAIGADGDRMQRFRPAAQLLLIRRRRTLLAGMTFEVLERIHLPSVIHGHHRAAIRRPRRRVEALLASTNGQRALACLHVPDLELLVQTHADQLRAVGVEAKTRDRADVSFEPRYLALRNHFPKFNHLVAASRREHPAVRADCEVVDGIGVRQPGRRRLAGPSSEEPDPAALRNGTVRRDQRTAVGTETQRRHPTDPSGSHRPVRFETIRVPQGQLTKRATRQRSSVRTPGQRPHGIAMRLEVCDNRKVRGQRVMNEDALPASDRQQSSIRCQRQRHHRRAAGRQRFELHLAHGLLAAHRRFVPLHALRDPAPDNFDLIRRELFLRRHVRIGVRQQRIVQKTRARLAAGDDLAAVATPEQRGARVHRESAFFLLLVVARETLVMEQPHRALRHLDPRFCSGTSRGNQRDQQDNKQARRAENCTRCRPTLVTDWLAHGSIDESRHLHVQQ